MSRRLSIALHVAFALVMLAAGFVLTFPWTSLQRRLEYEVERNVPGSVLAIGEVGPAAPIGVRFGDVVFERTAPGGHVTKISVDQIRVRPAFLKLLTGKPGVSFDVGLLGGEVKGTLTATASSRQIDAKLDELHLEEGGLVEQLSGLQLAGAVNGTVQLSLEPAKDAPKDGPVRFVATSGAIDAEVSGALVKGGKIMGFTLPALDLGAPHLSLTLEDAESKDAKFVTKSGDLDANITLDKLQMRADVGQSLVSGKANVKLSESWLNRNGSIKGMLSLAGSMVKNGAIELPLNGTLARPSPLLGLVH